LMLKPVVRGSREKIFAAFGYSGKYFPQPPIYWKTFANYDLPGLLMEKIPPVHLQEIIFSSSDKALSKQVSKLEKAGKIRKNAAAFILPISRTDPKWWSGVTYSPYLASNTLMLC